VVKLALKDPPKGFSLLGGLLPAEEDKVELRLRVLAAPRKESFRLSLEGHAQIGGRQTVRRAVPADDMMQAFFYRHLVPADELQVMVLPRARGKGRAGAARGSAATPKAPAKSEK
jgi:hypothetical protein